VNARTAAIEAARRGWAVFPCRPGDKRPAVDRWEQRACNDPGRVARFWPSLEHNLGIAAGPSKLVVVDLDTHGDLPEDWRLPGICDGRDVLSRVCKWAGQSWPATRVVATPSGGWHLYFTAPDGSKIRNSASLIGPLVDVRAGGGYVLGAGSAVDGKQYEVIETGDPVPLPSWIGRLLTRAPGALPASSREAAQPGARMQGLLAAVRGGQPGDRNNPLYWASRRAAEMITAGELAREDAEEALVGAALEAGLRGGESEARRTFASAMRGAGL
jgi:hypothetical protein